LEDPKGSEDIRVDEAKVQKPLYWRSLWRDLVRELIIKIFTEIVLIPSVAIIFVAGVCRLFKIPSKVTFSAKGISFTGPGSLLFAILAFMGFFCKFPTPLFDKYHLEKRLGEILTLQEKYQH